MNNILVCLDFSDVTQRVIQSANELARALTAKVRLLHVVPPENDYIMYSPGAVAPPSLVMPVARDLQAERLQLETLATEFSRFGIENSCEVREGSLIDEILKEADSTQADMIVMGSHGHGALYEFIVGSVTEGVLRRARQPVLVVPVRK